MDCPCRDEHVRTHPVRCFRDMRKYVSALPRNPTLLAAEIDLHVVAIERRVSLKSSNLFGGGGVFASFPQGTHAAIEFHANQRVLAFNAARDGASPLAQNSGSLVLGMGVGWGTQPAATPLDRVRPCSCHASNQMPKPLASGAGHGNLPIDVRGFPNASPMQHGLPCLLAMLGSLYEAMKSFSGDYRHRARFPLSKRPSPSSRSGRDACVGNPFLAEGN